MSRGLDLNKLKNRPRKAVSAKKALKNVVPFQWSKGALDGKRKVYVKAVDIDISKSIKKCTKNMVRL